MEGGLGCSWPRSIDRRPGGEGEVRSWGIWLLESRCGGVCHGGEGDKEQGWNKCAWVVLSGSEGDPHSVRVTWEEHQLSE